MHGRTSCLACGHLCNFENFIRFQKVQNQNVFQVIVSNFEFLTPDLLTHWPPLPPTITTENEKTPALAWCKLGPKNIFKFYVQSFFSIFFFFSLQKVFPSEPDVVQIQNHLRKCMLGDVVLLVTTFEMFIGYQKFQNQSVFHVILSNFDILPKTPPDPPPPPTTTTENDLGSPPPGSPGDKQSIVTWTMSPRSRKTGIGKRFSAILSVHCG